MNRTLWLSTHTSTHQPLMMDPTPTHSHNSSSMRWQDTLACILAIFSIYICVSASLKYGYYGDSRLLLGPSSSRLIKTSSVFVEQFEVRNKHNYNNDDNDDLLLYAFDEKPKLNSQTNWTTSKFLVVGAYSRKGISLWLNKGSTISMRWEAQASSINKLEGIVIKGERKVEKLQPKETIFPDAIAVRETDNGKEAEYIVEEDDRYHIGVLNMNARTIILTMKLNVSAKVYDTTKAKKICSAGNGSCKLGLFFPITYYVILTAPTNGDDGGWFVEVSYLARVIAYIVVLGFFIVGLSLIFKCLGVFDGDDHHNTNVMVASAQEVTETEPLIRVQQNPITYGTNKIHNKEESDASSSSSEELYDEKLCIICYDEQRNCFFVPCGHCATCYDCAQRIVNDESKVCPVCRRLIHRVRRLFHS